MDRTKTEQEFLDYCIKKGKEKLPIAIDLLELITDFIEVDRQKQLLIHSVSIAKRKLAIKFAEALLNDFEMSTKKDGNTLCWKLCGTPNELTTEELYDRYITEILAN